MSASTTTHTTPTSSASGSLDGFGSMVRSQFSSICSWDNPSYSSKVVVGTNAVFLTLWALQLNAFTTLFYTAALLLCAGLPLSHFLKMKAADKQVSGEWSELVI